MLDGADTPELPDNGRAPAERRAWGVGPARSPFTDELDFAELARRNVRFDADARRSVCRDCRRRRPCECDRRSEQADKDAARWARERGARIPHEIDTGRLMGDCRPTSTMLAGLARRVARRLELVEDLALVEGALEQFERATIAAAAVKERLARQARVLRARIEGETVKGLARALGYAGHASIIEITTEAQTGQRPAAELPSMTPAAARELRDAIAATGRAQPVAIQTEFVFPEGG